MKNNNKRKYAQMTRGQFILTVVFCTLLILIVFKLCCEKEGRQKSEPTNIPLEVEQEAESSITVLSTITLDVVEEVDYYEDTYTITAYCSCAKCCGKWANDRPVDANGNTLVYGAGGVLLWSGYHVASPLKFGTIVEIDGYKYEVQDRTSNSVANYYNDKIIDIYFSNHQQALEQSKTEKVVKIYGN